MEKSGRNKLKISLTHWFSAALKPIEVKTQGHVVAVLNGNISDATRYFLKWRGLYERRVEDKEMKQRGA